MLLPEINWSWYIMNKERFRAIKKVKRDQIIIKFLLYSNSLYLLIGVDISGIKVLGWLYNKNDINEYTNNKSSLTIRYETVLSRIDSYTSEISSNPYLMFKEATVHAKCVYILNTWKNEYSAHLSSGFALAKFQLP